MELNNAMRIKYLCPRPFRMLDSWENMCFYIARIAKSRHKGSFPASAALSTVKLVTSASKVVELLDEECAEVLDHAKEEMKIVSTTAFELQFVKYLSMSPLRTTVREKYLSGECDSELMEWDGSLTLPLSAKKLLDTVKEEIGKNVALRVEAANKQLAIKQMHTYAEVRLDSVCGAFYSLYRV